MPSLEKPFYASNCFKQDYSLGSACKTQHPVQVSHAKTSQEHRMFQLPEILEMILLETDLRTLLTSAQRVCYLWHDLILTSPRLQEALFFKPCKPSIVPGHSPARNPLLAEILWPELLCAKLHSVRENPSPWLSAFPFINPEREKVYLRPRASWRRMLLQQPPQFRIGVAQVTSILLPVDRLDFTQLEIEKADHPVRMEEILQGIHDGILVPCPDPWTFCIEPLYPSLMVCFLRTKEWVTGKPQQVPMLPGDCSIIVFTHRKVFYYTERTRKLGLRDKFETWVENIGQPHRLQSCVLKKVPTLT